MLYSNKILSLEHTPLLFWTPPSLSNWNPLPVRSLDPSLHENLLTLFEYDHFFINTWEYHASLHCMQPSNLRSPSIDFQYCCLSISSLLISFLHFKPVLFWLTFCMVPMRYMYYIIPNTFYNVNIFPALFTRADDHTDDEL